MALNKWNEAYPDNFTFTSLLCNIEWHPMIQYVIDNDTKGKIKELEEFIDYQIKEGTIIYPWPEDIYNAFDLSLSDVRVVILGQDPYINEENNIPQAMGLAFSVKEGITIPPSLNNIYNNLIKFGHIKSKPKGDLTNWVDQGCLLLNTSLTVTKGMSNSHKDYWIHITNSMIQYINLNTNNVVFMLWGAPSLGKLPLINQQKHYVTISSHPSPMSVKSALRSYDCFENTDHFGKANQYLKSKGLKPINWSL